MRKGKGSSEQSTPERYGDTTPPMPSGDYSYTVEIVMGMQRTLGKLEEAVEALKITQSDQGKKLDGIDKRIYAAIAVLVVFGSILTFFANSINTALTSRILAPTNQQQPLPTPSPTPNLTPEAKPR